LRKLGFVCITYLDALRIRQHFHHRRSDVGERDVTAGDRQGGGIQDEVGEPQAHGAFVAEDALEGRLHGSKIKKRLIHIEDDQRQSGHGFNSCLLACGVKFLGFRGVAESAVRVGVTASHAASAASFFRPRWILTLTSAADWPVALEASSMLAPSSFTRRMTRACAGLSCLSRSSTVMVVIAGSPAQFSIGMSSWNERPANRETSRTWSIH